MARAKFTVRARRSVKYREEVKRHVKTFPCTWQEQPTIASETVTTFEPMNRNTNCVTYWCEQAEITASKFKTLTGESTFQFLDMLYARYLINRNNDTFRDAIISISQLQKSVQQCEAAVLQLAGVGDKWARCEEIGRGLRDTLNALEDVLCHAMAGFEILVQSHLRDELLYQSLQST